MTNLTVYKDQDLNATIISNQFIDEYMVAANDAQIKIYLYLVRMTSANLSFSISDIADRFNYTEKDVLRALRYWEKQKLLSLDYDGERSLKAVHILPFPSLTPEGEVLPLTPKPSAMPEPVLVNSRPLSKASAPKDTPIVREAFSADDLSTFQNDNETAQIIFIAEQYTGKILSRNDL